MTKSIFIFLILLGLKPFVINSDWVTYDEFFKIIKQSFERDVKEGNIVRARQNCGKNQVMIASGWCGRIINIG